MKIFGAYLEDYHFIKVIIPKSFNYRTIKMIGNSEEITLNVFKEETYSNERHLYTSFLGYIKLHLDYQVTILSKHKEELSFHLNLGKITRTKRFDLDNYTTEKLGVIYTKEATTFKVWSPVAKEIKLIVNDIEYGMSYTNKGVWSYTVNKDVENATYYYMVRVNEEFIKCLDPYGISSTPNFTANLVVDLKKSYQMLNDYVHFDDPIIEELSIRDVTSLNGGGTFKDFTDSVNKDYGLGYLRNIGFNIGKYIYLLDAYEDLDKDYKKGRYNPFIDYIDRKEELKIRVDKLISMSLGMLGRRIDNLNLKMNTSIIENIVYSGVYLRYQNILEEGAK
jgi:hypothetical protein